MIAVLLAVSITFGGWSPPPAALGGVRGIASWYRYIPGHAAAGPALRRALGPAWRGKVVRVCRVERTFAVCVKVRLSDWCACYGSRVVDLDVRSFARLGSPSLGLVRVEVTP